MTKSRFDPDLEDYEDPDEAPLKEFWDAQRDREEAARGHQAAAVPESDGSDQPV